MYYQSDFFIQNMIYLDCLICKFFNKQILNRRIDKMISKDQQDTKEKNYMQNQNKRVFLKEQITKQQLNTMGKFMKILENQEWVLDMGVYSSFKMKNFMLKVDEARILKAWLSYNSHAGILLDIVKINFPYLKEISLAHNYIKSVQALALCDFPLLQELDLRENIINNIRPLKKLNLPHLKVVSLYRNLIIDLAPIFEMNTKNLRTLWLQYQEDEPVQSLGLSFVSKLQSNQLKSIAVGSANHMMLKRKCQNMKIYRQKKTLQS